MKLLNEKIDFQKILNISLTGIIYLIISIPLYSNSLFLFHTEEKTYLFRILVELGLIPWILININYKWDKVKGIFSNKYFNIFFFGFLTSALVSTILSINPYFSFWSTFVRTDGLLTLLHLYFFFLYLNTVLADNESWLNIFKFSICISLLVSAVAITDNGFITLINNDRIQGTVGNPGFLAGYMLFNIFFSFLVINNSNKLTKYLFIFISLIQSFVLFLTGTRGAYIALFLGFVLLLILSLLNIKNNKTLINTKIPLKKFCIYSIIIGSILSSLLVMTANFNKSSLWVQNTPLRYVTRINLAEGNIRFKVWNIALKGIQERPIFGWGPENFSAVFEKYFDPGLFMAEFRYDRVHNFILEIGINQGIVGVFLYIGLIAYLVKVIASDKVNNKKINYIMLSLLLAYLIQNMFLFDTITTQIMIYLILSYIFSTYLTDKKHTIDAKNRLNILQINIILIILFLISSTMIYYFNVRTALRSSIYRKIYTNNSITEETYRDLGKILKTNEMMSDYEIEIISDYLVRMSKNPLNLENELVKKSIINISVKLEENKVLQKDRLTARVALTDIYNSFSKMDSSYNNKAIDNIKEAIALSPNKQALYYKLIDIYEKNGEYVEALSVIESLEKFDPVLNINTKWKKYRIALRINDKNKVNNSLEELILVYKKDNKEINIPQAEQSVVVELFAKASKIAVVYDRVELFKELYINSYYLELNNLLEDTNASSEDYFKLLLIEIDLNRTENIKSISETIIKKNPEMKNNMNSINELVTKNTTIDSINSLSKL